MALTFGPELDDITADPEALGALLAGAPGEPADLDADPEPGWEEPRPSLRERLTGGARDSGKSARPVKVTAAVRKDVRAKTAMLLGLGAAAWSARDPYCGTVALESVDPVSDALADILCDSPDLVRWFSAGTGYMKWLTLAAALQPLAGAVVGHHVTHAVTLEPDDGQQEWAGYAAA